MKVKFIVDIFDVRHDAPGEIPPVRIIDSEWDYPVLPRVGETMYLASILPKKYKRYCEAPYLIHSIEWGPENIPYIYILLDREQYPLSKEDTVSDLSAYKLKPHPIRELVKYLHA